MVTRYTRGENMKERDAFEAWYDQPEINLHWSEASSWEGWIAACKWQRQQDEEICRENAAFAAKQARGGGTAFDDGRDSGSLDCANDILNQEFHEAKPSYQGSKEDETKS